MGVSLASELKIFIACVLAGLSGGSIYDIFTYFYKPGTKKLFVSLGDAVLAVIVCGICVTVFYAYGSFELRWHMFIGLFLGILLYFLLFRGVFVFVFEKILKLFHFIFKILLTPTRFLYKILVGYFFVPVCAFVKLLLLKISGGIKKSINKRGKDNGRKKKKHKKKVAEADNGGTFCGGSVLYR